MLTVFPYIENYGIQLNLLPLRFSSNTFVGVYGFRIIETNMKSIGIMENIQHSFRIDDAKCKEARRTRFVGTQKELLVHENFIVLVLWEVVEKL